MIAGQARHHRHRRAGAAVPDPRLDAARRDDGGRGADAAEGAGPACRTAARCWPAPARCCGCSRRRSCAPAARSTAILDTTPRAQSAARGRRICPTSCCRRISPRAWRCCARCKAKVPVVGVASVAAVGDGKLSEVVVRARRRACRPISCCCTRAWCPTSISPSPSARRIDWDERQLCFQPVLDEDFGSSVPGIAVAGDGAGIAGGTAAAERGRLAAIAAVRALKPDAHAARSAERAPAPAARGDGPRLPRLAEPSGRLLPPARGRHDGLPLRGGDGGAGPVDAPTWAAKGPTR